MDIRRATWSSQGPKSFFTKRSLLCFRCVIRLVSADLLQRFIRCPSSAHRTPSHLMSSQDIGLPSHFTHVTSHLLSLVTLMDTAINFRRTFRSNLLITSQVTRDSCNTISSTLVMPHCSNNWNNLRHHSPSVDRIPDFIVFSQKMCHHCSTSRFPTPYHTHRNFAKIRMLC